MPAQSTRPDAFEFARFKLHPQRRELLADGVPVELGGRAFDVLLALLEANGKIIGKSELIARVWPGRVVEENNLLVQIAALRRALGPDRELLRTVAGQGYHFCAPLRVRACQHRGWRSPGRPHEPAYAGDGVDRS
jgi:DNA-binding winged helix-turn-helix (wHTH) protein